MSPIRGASVSLKSNIWSCVTIFFMMLLGWFVRGWAIVKKLEGLKYEQVEPMESTCPNAKESIKSCLFLSGKFLLLK